MSEAAAANYWGSFVFSYRRLHSLTQEQLSERLEVSQQTVSRWEAGQQLPDPGSQAKLRQVLGEADLNSGKHWRERVRRSACCEVLMDRRLEFLAVSAAMANLIRLLPEEMIGKTIGAVSPGPRPKVLEQLVDQGFFDGKIVRCKVTFRNDLGPRSYAYHADAWPILTSERGILLHGCLFPFPVDHAPGIESSRSENLEIEFNDLVGTSS